MNGTDLELLERYAGSRDAEAFAELVARNQDLVYAACYRVLGRRSDAEDAAQECFLALARNAGAVKTSLAGWLHRVAVRAALAIQRKSRARSRAEREAATMLAASEAGASWEDVKTEIDTAIDHLPEHLREPVVLHFLQGKTQTAVAQEIGVSQSVVSVRIKEAIERLRSHLKGTGLAVTAAGLAVLLETHAVDAAPATLVASLGKMALAGVAPASAPTAAAASALGLTATMGPGAKIACVVIATVAVGLTLREAVESRGGGPPASPAAQSAPRSLADTALAAGWLDAVHVARGLTGRAESDKARQQGVPVAAASAAREVPKLLRTSARLASQPTIHRRTVKPRLPVGRKARYAPNAQAAPGPMRLAQAPPPPRELPEPRPQLPPGREPDMVELEVPGVTLRYERGLDEAICTAIGSVVSVARAELVRTFPDLGAWRRHDVGRHISVHVLPALGHYESTVTDRQDTIYIRLGEKGLGEYFRADAGPVGILCQAVVELHNARRIPGLARYTAHRYLVPAVHQELGPDVLPTDHATTLGEDGPEMLAAIKADDYTLVHPDFAAVAALDEIDRYVGLDALRRLLARIPDDAEDTLSFLLDDTVAHVPELKDLPALETCTKANELELDEDGTCLVASFENLEALAINASHPLGDLQAPLPVKPATDLQLTLTPEWQTHGAQSIRFEGEDVGESTTVGIWDPDWRFKDWTRFSKFEMDLLVQAPAPVRIRVRVHDDVARGHGQVDLFDDTVEPDKPVHVSYALDRDSLRGTSTSDAAYFGGRFRAAEVASLDLTVVDRPAGPIALLVDNVRLTARDDAPGGSQSPLVATGTGPSRVGATAASEGGPGATATGPGGAAPAAADPGGARAITTGRGEVGAARVSWRGGGASLGIITIVGGETSERRHIVRPTNVSLDAAIEGLPEALREIVTPDPEWNVLRIDGSEQQAREVLDHVARMEAELLRAIGEEDAPPWPQAPAEGIITSVLPVVDEPLVDWITQVVHTAWAAIGELLPDRHLEQIHLKIYRGQSWHENVVTDRVNTIHVRVGPHGIGDAMRGDAGPIAVLCEAVAELHNVPRIAGFDRYIAHRYLVPAVVGELGEDIAPCPHPTPLGPDGAEMLDAILREEYTSVHPDIAAAAALQAIEAQLGFDGLCLLLDAVPEEGHDGFAELRELAIEADADLADAFGAYDEAMHLEPDEDGTCLLTSFEPEESVQRIPQPYPLPSAEQPVWLEVSPGVEWAITDDWATDGSQSLRMNGDKGRGRMALVIRDPDWKFRDLQRFSEFEFDLLVEAPDIQPVEVRISDHVADGHGQIDVLSDLVRPGEWRHIVFELTEENLWGRKGVDALYFGGQFRADAASRIHIGLGQLEQPVTFYLDNLRFRLRDAVDPLPGAGGPR